MDDPGQRSPGRYALIPTHNRPAELAELVAVVSRETTLVIVIDNASTPPLEVEELRQAAGLSPADSNLWVIRDESQPPNLPRMWNAGFRVIADHVRLASDVDTPGTPIGFDPHRWDVAVLNDDALPHEGWLTHTADTMRSWGDGTAAAACMLPLNGPPLLKTQPDSDLSLRMYGPAFIVRGELGLQADERMAWWWQDTDLDWQSRGRGGMLVVPGPYVPNRHANESTVGELAEQAGRDGQAFVTKWGWRPW